MSSVYTEPEAFGLRQVAEFDAAESYEFSMVVLWRDHRGDLWAAYDSGCSCPTPFEDHKFPTDFVQVRAAADVEPLLRKTSDGYFGAAALLDFQNAVREAVRS